MIYSCPGCSSKFQGDAGRIVICPSCGAKVRLSEAARAGTAWDRAKGGGRVAAFFDTVKSSIADPTAFFEEVAAGEGWMRPWLFATVIMFMVFLMAAAYQAGFQVLAVGINLASEIEHLAAPFYLLSFPVMMVAIVFALIIVVPVLATTAIFLQSGIYHLCLMIIGSARRDFWSTFRCVCYTAGPQLFQIVPFLGSVVGPMWQLALAIIGLKVVHRTTYGRSALAVFLPTILCCGALFLVVAAVAGGVAAALLKGAVAR